MLWRFVKSSVILVSLVLVLLVAYVVYNWPIAPKYRKLSDSEIQNYMSYLDEHGSDPKTFISDQFRHHDIVLIGEFHKRKQDVDFVRSLIPYLYENNGVTVIGWEFGASELQNEVDSLISASAYDAKAATSILRRTCWFWDYQEYLDFYKAIWQYNHSLPTGAERIRFLQLGSVYNEAKLQSPDKSVRIAEARLYNYDRKMCEIMEREVILKKKKALWYSGLHHAFTKFHVPTPFFFKGVADNNRGGNYLYDKYPDRIYLSALHAPAFGRLFFLLPGFVPNYYPWGAVFDKIYDRRRSAFAFDVVTSPFASCEDNYSYYSLDHWGPIQLQDFCDGYVFLGSLKETEPVHPISSWIADSADSAEVFSTLSTERRTQLKTVRILTYEIESDPVKMIRLMSSLDSTGYAE